MEIAAVIPAYNEEKTIEDVLRVVVRHPKISDVIVVNDGSVDATSTVAKKCGARVVDLPHNLGKGGAMLAGVENTTAQIILFLDADLIGLTSKHIDDLLCPVLAEETAMTIGVFGSGRFATDLAQKVAPFLSGQRAVKRDVVQAMEGLDLTRYGVEIAMTKYANDNSIEIKPVLLEDMTHVMKEEKLGVVKGVAARMKMYWDIIRCLAR